MRPQSLLLRAPITATTTHKKTRLYTARPVARPIRRMPPPPPAAAGRGGGAATDDEKAKAVAIFRATWDVYTKVVEHDYMSHVLLSEALSRDMQERHGGGTEGVFSIVDIGCGGADAFAAMLRRAPTLAARIGSYTGVDLSDIALAHARANMLGGPVQGGFPDVRSSAPADGALLPAPAAASSSSPQPPRAAFVEADMVSFAESLPPQSADVVVAAFALHHLTPDLKARTCAAVARALKPGGTFYYQDVWMEETDTREAYLDRYRKYLDSWPALTEQERAFIWDHVSAHDYPATEREVAALSCFERCEAVARDGGPHRLLRLTGPRVAA
jgi:SAM-dependent methyltransferase